MRVYRKVWRWWLHCPGSTLLQGAAALVLVAPPQSLTKLCLASGLDLGHRAPKSPLLYVELEQPACNQDLLSRDLGP